jgi:hypothetical protein
MVHREFGESQSEPMDESDFLEHSYALNDIVEQRSEKFGPLRHWKTQEPVIETLTLQQIQ